MYTSHGHQIFGTTVEANPPVKARCGGPALCSTCGAEAAQAQRDRAFAEQASETPFDWVKFAQNIASLVHVSKKLEENVNSGWPNTTSPTVQEAMAICSTFEELKGFDGAYISDKQAWELAGLIVFRIGLDWDELKGKL